MGMRQIAESDLSVILEDAVIGGAWPITIIDPELNELDLTGWSSDIAQVIDPDTGVIVSGRAASVAIRISTLIDNNFLLPVGIAESESKPWAIRFNDINGFSHKFKVIKSNPDRTLGVVTCLLEVYR